MPVEWMPRDQEFFLRLENRFNGAPIVRRMKKETIVATLSVEYKYIAFFDCVSMQAIAQILQEDEKWDTRADEIDGVSDNYSLGLTALQVKS